MTEGQAPAAPATPAAPAAAPATPAPSTPELAAPTSQEPVGNIEESVLDAELPEGTDHFDRPYVEKLRKEAAGKRDALKAWKKLEGLNDHRGQPMFQGPDDIHEFLSIFADPRQFLSWYRETAQGMPPEILRQVVADLIQNEEAAPEPQEDPKRPLTVEEFQQYQQMQQQMAVQQREDREVESTLRSLKVPKEDREYVIRFAQSEKAKAPRISLAEALKRGQATFRKRLEAHAASAAQTTQEHAAKTPGALGGSPAAPADKHDGEWKTAKERAKQRIDASLRASNPS